MSSVLPYLRITCGSSSSPRIGTGFKLNTPSISLIFLTGLRLLALRSLGHCTTAVFLTLLIFDLRHGLIYSSSAAAKRQKADYSNEKEFHFR